MKKKWYEQKTTWTALIMAAIAIASAFTPISVQQIAAIEAGLGAIALIFLRQGVENSK